MGKGCGVHPGIHLAQEGPLCAGNLSVLSTFAGGFIVKARNDFPVSYQR